jgi:hypothetical protein
MLLIYFIKAFIKNSPHQAPRVNDKSLDSHLILNVHDSATTPAPNMVECPVLQASLSMEHRKNLVVPFSKSPFPATCPVDCNSIDCHSPHHAANSISNDHATIPTVLVNRMNNVWDYLGLRVLWLGRKKKKRIEKCWKIKLKTINLGTCKKKRKENQFISNSNHQAYRQSAVV